MHTHRRHADDAVGCKVPDVVGTATRGGVRDATRGGRARRGQGRRHRNEPADERPRDSRAATRAGGGCGHRYGNGPGADSTPDRRRRNGPANKESQRARREWTPATQGGTDLSLAHDGGHGPGAPARGWATEDPIGPEGPEPARADGDEPGSEIRTTDLPSPRAGPGRTGKGLPLQDEDAEAAPQARSSGGKSHRLVSINTPDDRSNRTALRLDASRGHPGGGLPVWQASAAFIAPRGRPGRTASRTRSPPRCAPRGADERCVENAMEPGTPSTSSGGRRRLPATNAGWSTPASPSPTDSMKMSCLQSSPKVVDIEERSTRRSMSVFRIRFDGLPY